MKNNKFDMVTEEYEKHWNSSRSWSEEGYYVAAGCAVWMMILAALAIIVY